MNNTPSRPVDPDWMEHGLCRTEGHPTKLFYPDERGSIVAAKKVCARCPLTQICLEHALSNKERHGVWGGCSERERNRIRRQRAVDAAA